MYISVCNVSVCRTRTRRQDDWLKLILKLQSHISTTDVRPMRKEMRLNPKIWNDNKQGASLRNDNKDRIKRG